MPEEINLGTGLSWFKFDLGTSLHGPFVNFHSFQEALKPFGLLLLAGCFCLFNISAPEELFGKWFVLILASK